MILLRVNISEESGTIQVQRRADPDGGVTAHERALCERFLAAMTRELSEYSKSIGGDAEVVKTVHRKMDSDCRQDAGSTLERKPSMSNVTGGNAS